MISGAAIATRSDGRIYVDQKIEHSAGHLWSISASPLPSDSPAVNPSATVTRVVFWNTVSTYLPFSTAISFSCCLGFDWNVLHARAYKKNETISVKPFSSGVQNVDTFGCDRKRVFRFRQVVEAKEAEMLLAELASDILSPDKVQLYVDEAIYLKRTRHGFDPSLLKTELAPTGTVGLVNFYWLNNINQNLRYTSQQEEKCSIVPSETGKDLLVTYPIHPNANPDKVNATVALLKDRFETTLGRSFDVMHIPNTPLEIYEPDTLRSNFPTPDALRA